MAVAAPAIAVAGLLLGLLFARVRFRGQSVVETAVMLPMILPPSVVGYVLLRALGREGPLQGWLGINLLFTWKAAAVASAIVGLPLMVQAAKVGIAHVDHDIEQAAMVDGASRLRILLTITIPLARRGILIGILLGSVRALGEFGATLAVAGSIPGRTQTLPLAVYDAMQRADFALANRLALLMIVIGYLAVWLSHRLSERAES
jgi:molybdate transport system permease protein